MTNDPAGASPVERPVGRPVLERASFLSLHDRKRPTGFVATCQCGKEVGALDVERAGREDTARLLGMWLMQGCTVAPRFTANWSASIEMCECGKTPNA